MRLLSVASLSLLAACSSTITCFPKARPDLVGRWEFVRRPGENAGLGDLFGPPHPQTLELRGNGTYEAVFTGSELDKLRRINPDADVTERIPGVWAVHWFCAQDLFMPRQWLHMNPGIDQRLFRLRGDQLTLYFPSGSGCCHEQYERAD